MNKFQKVFENGKAYIGFITCGDPDLATTEKAVLAAAENGADIIELNIPFSDPTAVDATIQEANIRALEAGVTTDKIFDFIQEHQLLELHQLYNINIPASPKGIRITRQGGPYYSDDFPCIGNDLYKPMGKPIWEDSGDETLDTDATLHGGYITITPLQLDRTNRAVFDRLKTLNT